MEITTILWLKSFCDNVSFIAGLVIFFSTIGVFLFTFFYLLGRSLSQVLSISIKLLIISVIIYIITPRDDVFNVLLGERILKIEEIATIVAKMKTLF